MRCLYYIDGDFMSRNNIEQGHITLHPKEFLMDQRLEQWKEASVIKNSWLAVMVDTFRPLMVTETAMGLDDGSIINPGSRVKIMSLPSERGFCTKHYFKINIISVNHFSFVLSASQNRIY
jgi:hypothetical protein